MWKENHISDSTSRKVRIISVLEFIFVGAFSALQHFSSYLSLTPASSDRDSEKSLDYPPAR